MTVTNGMLQSQKNYNPFGTVPFTAWFISYGCVCIPSKWVFKLKGHGTGRIARYKARVVACGYRQKFGRDFNRTYSPVAHAATIRMPLSLAVVFRLTLRQYDIKTAFLYGRLPEHQRVYLRPPQGLDVPDGMVLQL